MLILRENYQNSTFSVFCLLLGVNEGCGMVEEDVGSNGTRKDGTATK